jgi:polyisoprenoid-binding protein YceI
MTNTVETAAPQLVGTWTGDAVHTDVVFKVRHMGVGKSTGSFQLSSATLSFAGEGLETGSVTAVIDAGSVHTKNDMRDNHVRSADFLDVENHPTIDFTSTEIRDFDGETFVLVGDLTVRGVTKRVELAAEFLGATIDAYGKSRTGFSAIGSINRKDFGVSFSAAFGVSNSVVSDKVELSIDIEFVKDEPAESTEN